jgi:hypothetical protein
MDELLAALSFSRHVIHETYFAMFTMLFYQRNAVESGGDQRGVAKSAEKRRGTGIADNAPFGDPWKTPNLFAHLRVLRSAIPKIIAFRKDFSRARFPSPREGRAGRGSGRGAVCRNTTQKQTLLLSPPLPMNRSASSPHPSPPFGMEERVAAGWERRLFVVLGFKARTLVRRILSSIRWRRGTVWLRLRRAASLRFLVLFRLHGSGLVARIGQSADK